MRNNKNEGKLIKLIISDEIKINDCLKLKQKNEDNQTVKKIVKGWRPSADLKLSEGVEVEMIVDVKNDTYNHKVIDKKTGELVHEEDMKLSEHK